MSGVRPFDLLFQRFRQRNPDADFLEVLDEGREIPPQDQRGWIPCDFLDEDTPLWRGGPDDWIGDLVKHCGVVEGEIVPFTWECSTGTAKLTIAAEGTWSLDRPLPPETNLLVGYLPDDCWREPSLFDARTVEDLAKQALDESKPWHPRPLRPYTVEVHGWETSLQELPHQLMREGDKLRFVPVTIHG